MPVTTRLAVTSSRAFGEFASSLTLTTVTFTANGTWTAPTNVSLVTTLYGKGSDGVSDSTAPASADPIFRLFFGASGSTFGSPPPLPTDYNTIYGYLVSAANQINTGGSGVVSYSIPGFGNLSVASNGNWNSYFTPVPNYFPGYAVANTATINWALPTSGAISWVGPGNVQYNGSVSFTAYYYGNAGSDSTALGYTFPGGAYVAPTGYPATPATYTNVSVTPGASYSIVVPSGGQVQISYYT